MTPKTFEFVKCIFITIFNGMLLIAITTFLMFINRLRKRDG